MAEGTKRFLTTKFESRKRRRGRGGRRDVGCLTVARFPNRGFGSRGEGNLRGKAGNRHDFFAPVEIRKGRAPSPVLRLFSTLFLSLSLYFFVQGYVYIYTSFES